MHKSEQARLFLVPAIFEFTRHSPGILLTRWSRGLYAVLNLSLALCTFIRVMSGVNAVEAWR